MRSRGTRSGQITLRTRLYGAEATLYHAGVIDGAPRKRAPNQAALRQQEWASVPARLAQTLQGYVEQMRVALRANSMPHIERTLREFALWITEQAPDVKAVRDLRRVHIERYKRHVATKPNRRGRKSSKRTLAGELSTLRICLERLAEWDSEDAPARPARSGWIATSSRSASRASKRAPGIICDVSRDTSPGDRNDRRLWLSERCPSCGAAAATRCQSRSLTRRKPPTTLTLHAARGWRQRPCPTCKALPGEPCFTPRGRAAARPHTARLHPARGELHALEDVWRALERAGAEIAQVRFSGGGGRQSRPDSVSLHAGDRELTRWCDADETELAAALAAPVWGRYGSFRGQPPIAATLTWNVADRMLRLAGRRGTDRFQETLQAAATPALRDASLAAKDGHRPARTSVGRPRATARTCCRCGQPIAADARSEARYCSKRCRQAASRARLRERSGRAALKPPQRCALCDGPMPAGLRPEARYCSKRCRQAASRARLSLAHARSS